MDCVYSDLYAQSRPVEAFSFYGEDMRDIIGAHGMASAIDIESHHSFDAQEISRPSISITTEQYEEDDSAVDTRESDAFDDKLLSPIYSRRKSDQHSAQTRPVGLYTARSSSVPSRKAYSHDSDRSRYQGNTMDQMPDALVSPSVASPLSPFAPSPTSDQVFASSVKPGPLSGPYAQSPSSQSPFPFSEFLVPQPGDTESNVSTEGEYFAGYLNPLTSEDFSGVPPTAFGDTSALPHSQLELALDTIFANQECIGYESTDESVYTPHSPGSANDCYHSEQPCTQSMSPELPGRGRGLVRRGGHRSNSHSRIRGQYSPYSRPTMSAHSPTVVMAMEMEQLRLSQSGPSRSPTRASRSPSIVSQYSSEGLETLHAPQPLYPYAQQQQPETLSPLLLTSSHHDFNNHAYSGESSPSGHSPFSESSMMVKLEELSPLDEMGGGDYAQQPSFRPQVGSQAIVNASEQRRTKEAKFKCAFAGCSASFTAKHNLQNHVNSHKGIKNYKCPQCHRDFGTSHVLRRHMKKCAGKIPLSSTSRKKRVH